jgi:hypothetical protein
MCSPVYAKISRRNLRYLGACLEVVHSRKPSPNYIGVHAEFDKVEFSKYIAKTISLLKKTGCKAEFIFRDIYTLHGNIKKSRQAVEITRRFAENL